MDHTLLVLSRELVLLLIVNQLASVSSVLIRLSPASLNCEFDNSVNILRVKGRVVAIVLTFLLEHVSEISARDDATRVLDLVMLRSK